MERTTPSVPRELRRLTDYQRGFFDGSQDVVRLIAENMTRKRPGTMPSISLERFDAVVERHLEAVGLPDDPQGLSDAEIRRIVAENRRPGQDS